MYIYEVECTQPPTTTGFCLTDYFYGDFSRLGRKNLWVLLVGDFYTLDALPVTQQPCQSPEEIEWN